MTHEEAVWIDGPFGKMFGIVHYPAVADVSSCIIMPNSGQISRVGPQRLYVTAARRWADEGFVCLRLDLAGVGDSQAENEDLHFDGHMPEEVIAAIDFAIKGLRATSVYLVGLCSGARVSIKAAAQCEDVAAVIAWSCPIVSSSAYMPSSPHENQNVFGGAQASNPFLDAVDDLVGSGRDIFFIFGERDNLPVAEFRNRFHTVPNSRSLPQAYHIIPHATHTFNAVDSQQALISVSTDWLRARRTATGTRAEEALPANP